jgi:hypothetical protein
MRWVMTVKERLEKIEAMLAVRRAGPETFALVNAVGAGGAKAVRVLARHGEEGATWVRKRPEGMSALVMGRSCN